MVVSNFESTRRGLMGTVLRKGTRCGRKNWISKPRNRRVRGWKHEAIQ